MLEDLFQPSVLLASHQYFPWSAVVKDSIVTDEIPTIPVVFSLGTGKPSLYHWITGRGIPEASHLIFTLFPVEMVISLGELTMRLGGDGAVYFNILKIKYSVLSQPFLYMVIKWVCMGPLIAEKWLGYSKG